MLKPECIRCGQRVGWVGIGVNLVMVALKIIVGINAGSRACLADALHSSSNIITAFAIFVSRKLIGKPIDEKHPYGYGKVEFIAAGAVSVLIMILTVALVVTAVEHIIYKPVPPPHPIALLVAVLSIATNEMLFRYFRCVGTELNSQTIIANAWANRADCFSSAAVVVGVLGAQLGFHHLDPIAAVIVAGIIIKVSVNCIRDAIAGLMDRSMPPEVLEALRKAVSKVKEIEEIQHIRARLLGNKIWVELGVQVSSAHTVNDCEEIRGRVHSCVLEGVPAVGKIFVDFEPIAETAEGT